MPQDTRGGPRAFLPTSTDGQYLQDLGSQDLGFSFPQDVRCRFAHLLVSHGVLMMI